MATSVLGCADCGTRQKLPHLPSGAIARCVACDGLLERTHGRSSRLALACAAAALLLLVPSNLSMFLRTDALGVSRSSHLISTATVMFADGWPWLAVPVFLFVVLFPFLRFGLLTAVLGALALKRRPPWLGRVFRWANALQSWTMPDVFLLGLAVAYARLADSIAVTIGPGAYCFVAVGLLSLALRAALDKNAVWQRIAPDAAPANPVAAVSCTSCDLLVDATTVGTGCPRCGAVVRRRKPESMSRTIALTLAGLILYVPANIYPLATLPINFKPSTYTVLQGVIDLVQAGLWDLAILVFCASFLIPFLKLAGLGWCVLSVLRRSPARLRAKTRAYRVVEEIGRWSMVDPFVIGVFVPVMTYNNFIYGRAEAAAVPFTAVVILTMISARTFDPRLMWDAAERRA